MLLPTAREPLCDIKAQMYALYDPAHPKDAVWISRGTPARIVPDPSLYIASLPEGEFYTNNQAKAEFFHLLPTEEGLAAVLGYLKSKSEIDPDNAVVVQALDLRGCVISEMVIDYDDVLAGEQALRSHGRIVIVPLWTALMRRAMLCAAEDEENG